MIPLEYNATRTKGKKKEQQTRCRLKESWFEVSCWGLLDGGEIVPATILAGGYGLDWFESSPPKLKGILAKQIQKRLDRSMVGRLLSKRGMSVRIRLQPPTIQNGE